MQATGSQSYIAICDETTYGVTPASPTLQKLTAMVYGESLGASYEEVVSNSVNGTRAKSDVRNGNQTVSGRVPFELSIAKVGSQLELGDVFTDRSLVVTPAMFLEELRRWSRDVLSQLEGLFGVLADNPNDARLRGYIEKVLAT